MYLLEKTLFGLDYFEDLHGRVCICERFAHDCWQHNLAALGIELVCNREPASVWTIDVFREGVDSFVPRKFISILAELCALAPFK